MTILFSRIKMFLIIWIICLGSVSAFPNNSSTVCFLHNRTQSYICDQHSMQLSCSGEHVIRINNIQVVTISTGNLLCSKCQLNYTAGGWDIVTDIVYFETLLYQACSRKNRCNFYQNGIQSLEQSKFIWKANINYECVSKDLFKSICSPWKQTTDTVHISLNRTGKATGNCSCIVEEYTENINMEVVDYRPYGNDFGCAGSTFIIGDSVIPQCENTGVDFSMYNTNITVINNVTIISILFSEYFPQMIWIHVKGNIMTVQCNNEGMSLTSSPSSSSSTDSIFTDTLTTLPETTKENTNTETNTAMTTSSLLNKGNEDRTIFSLPVIAGGSAGLLFLVVFIAVIICFLCRRKQNQTSKAKDKENMYAQFNAQSNTANISPIKCGVINQGYETENKRVHIVLKDFSNSNYEEVGRKNEEADVCDYDGTEYAEPADVVADNIYAETSKTEAGIQMSQIAQSSIEGHNYTEPYDKDLIIGTEFQNNNAKGIKSGQKKEAYDTCGGIENYSHILTGMIKQAPQTKENYSHIHIAGNKQDTSCLGNYSHTKVRPREGIKAHECSDMYTHVQNDTPKQQGLSYKETKETKSDEEEYDHLNNFPHP